MADEDNDFSNFLAYTKSPKTSKRTTFQDELQRAINARVSRQKAIEETEYSEYSEEFESDDSLDESYSKNNSIKSKPEKTLHDFQVSDEEDDFHRKLSFLKTKSQFGSNIKDDLGDMGMKNDRNNGNHGTGQKLPVFDEEKKDQRIIENTESKPIPKPRENVTKKSLKTESINISRSTENFKPIPQQRNVLRKSGQSDEQDSPQLEDTYSSKEPVSLSAPSSLTKLNQKASASGLPVLSENVNPEANWMLTSSSQLSRSKTFPLLVSENNMAESQETAHNILKDLQINKIQGHDKPDSQESGRRSPSVLEIMLSSAKERNNQQDKDHQHYSELCPISEQGIKKMEMDKNSGLKKSKSSRSLSSMQTITKPPKSGTQIVAKSRYLGTLTVLDKSPKEINSDIEPADAVRATVYQNWLGRKKVFLHELNKIKKAEEEQEKEKQRNEEINKREEAQAAFNAWKTEKSKEIRKSHMKQKEVENKKMSEIQEMAHRKEDSRKAFEKWKEHKEGYFKEKILKVKQIEKEKKKQEQETVIEKKKENISAIKSWNAQKEQVLKEKQKEKLYETMEYKKIKAEKEDKEKKALAMYEKWLEKKERRERIEKKQKKLIFDDDPPPPWSPPGKTIPTGK